MRPFSSRMFPHSVFARSLSEASDLDGGTVETLPAAPVAIPCRIRLRGSHAEVRGEQEVGITLADLAFPANPGTKKGDQFQKANTGQIYRAMAAAQARDGDNALFVVSCEVIE